MQFPYIQSAIPHPFSQTKLSLPNRHTGKVREIYSLEPGKVLLVTTDRLSAFDRVLGAVPYKGQVLNQLSAWWFEQIQEIIPSHLIMTPDPNAMRERRSGMLKTYPAKLRAGFASEWRPHCRQKSRSLSLVSLPPQEGHCISGSVAGSLITRHYYTGPRFSQGSFYFIGCLLTGRFNP